ncbi:sensor histidine kinase [Winslowiella iniecta]|uniref:histidine kinase n=1 Tax=Winslowiella iniecta TaxID=1560201 RepID=A0A0L7T4N0_9GAMM|nr:HAMP domain-containing sensor histidine kinase [Winslowiella iniecta]KOC90171.1 histidine kinase [Winslowiella iniecta]KOC94165.1 histidine kinase [Winslowiella iniecta]
MKIKYFYILILILSFLTIIFITTNKFNGIKEQYNTIEPNLDNYSAAEVLFLSFERMKVALLSPMKNDDFLLKKKIFDSKIMILENKSNNHESFFHDTYFLTLIYKIKLQSSELSVLYADNVDSIDLTSDAIAYMNKMHSTLLDIQEVAYRIQIRNFNRTKDIIKDNSSDTEFYSLLCIVLSFILIMLLWRHITKLKDTLLKKNIFISAIYHELSGSIQKIQISSEMIDVHSNVVMADKYISTIKLHSNKIFHQTREILEYSKIEIGNSELNNLRFFIEDLVNEARVFCEEKNKNQLIVKSNSDKKIINADKQKLLSIIINLIDNANKNTQNGTIILTVKLLNSRLYMRVQDNGCGFDIKNLASLYHPFNQGAEKETRQGLGLGLTIIKSYVKIFNGKINVKSKPGSGSSFLICIPVIVITG